jgi:hypothetical protein
MKYSLAEGKQDMRRLLITSIRPESEVNRESVPGSEKTGKKMMNRLALVLALIVLSSSSVVSARSYKIDESRSPKEFLDELCNVHAGLNVRLVEDSVWGWVQPSDVAELMDLIDSDFPCRSVALAYSSFIRFDGSSMGDEAAFLVEGYRQCRYPPSLSSKALSDSDRAALKEWWSQTDLAACAVVNEKIDESKSPKEFLDELCGADAGMYVVEDSIRGWVQPSDVAELMVLIDSSVPCRSVALKYSYFNRWNGSTMGDEAAFLVEGYRQCKYPPDGTSTQLSDADRAAMKEWWSAAELSECPAGNGRGEQERMAQ